MAQYSLSPIFQPQWITGTLIAPAPLVWAPTVAGGGFTVPAGYNFVINTIKIINNSTSGGGGGASEQISVWRVNNGAATSNDHNIVPPVFVPPASISFPWFDLTALWGAVMQEGDYIYMGCGTANICSVHADGAIIAL